jgi:hypothetical protein
VNTALPTSSSSIASGLFAPDADAVAYVGAQETADLNEAYLVSLASGAPSAWRKLSPTLSSGGSVYSYTLAWSNDSSRVGYLAKSSTSSAQNLYLSDALSGTPTGKPVASGTYCSTSGTTTTCRDVSSFKFQP